MTPVPYGFVVLHIEGGVAAYRTTREEIDAVALAYARPSFGYSEPTIVPLYGADLVAALRAEQARAAELESARDRIASLETLVAGKTEAMLRNLTIHSALHAEAERVAGLVEGKNAKIAALETEIARLTHVTPAPPLRPCGGCDACRNYGKRPP